jgi:hypothetical protein
MTQERMNDPMMQTSGVSRFMAMVMRTRTTKIA